MNKLAYSQTDQRRLPATLLGLALLMAPLGHGQNDDGDDEVFELSPFVISSEDSEGYRSRNTLAGTRIKTELKDLGASISVITEEFLEDTGATGIEDLFLYTGGTEIGGPDGNFSGIDFGADAAGSVFSDDAGRINPSAGARVRGIARPNFTRNYFSTDIRVDSYNTGGITISRGANSLLFGLGSAAGVVENSVKMPVVGEDKTKVSLRFDHNSSVRATIDLTRTIIEDRLAVKFSGLRDDKKFTQNPAYMDESRAYGAFNWTVFKNEESSWLGKTSIRGNLETGDSIGTPPKSIAPIVAYDSFFIPPPNFAEYNGYDYFTSAGTDGFIESWEKWKILDTREAADGTPGYRETFTAEGDYPVYSTPFFFWPGMVTFQASGDLSTGIPGRENIQGFRTWPRTSNVNTPSGIRHRPAIHVNTRAYENAQQGGGFRTRNLNNPAIFDYRNNLLTGDMDQVEMEFDAQTFYLEQSLFGGKGGFEIAIDHQDHEQYSLFPFGGNARNIALFIDTTAYLPDGTPNPNAGKAFMTSAGSKEQDERRIRERDNERAIAFYNLDFADIGDKWAPLGRHSVTLLAQREEFRQSRFRTRGFLDGPVRNANPLNSGQNGFNGVYYLTDASAAGMEEGEMRFNQLSRDMLMQDGDTFTTLHYPYSGPGRDPKFSTVNDPVGEGFIEQPWTFRRWLSNVNYQREEIESKALAWQSYLFDGHIVGLVGLREDDVTEYQQARVDPETGEMLFREDGSPDTRGIVRVGNELLTDSVAAVLPVTDPTGKTTTWSVVGHLPEKYLENLPLSRVSAHYGVSENFSPGESGIDHDLNFIPAPQGETVEYGVDISFAGDAWNLRVNRYETDQQYKSAGSLTSQVNHARSRPLNWINNWYDVYLDNTGLSNLDADGNPQPDTDFDLVDGSGVVNIQNVWDAGYRDWMDLVNDLRGLIPDRLSDLYQYELNDDGLQFVETGPGVDNLKGVQNVRSKGWGVYLTGRPTKSWNVSANLTQTEAVPYGSGEPFGRYVGELYSNLRDLGLLGINESVNGITKPSIRLQQSLAEVVNLQSQDGFPAPEVREWRFNAVTNYKFREGKLKGAGVGGAMRYQSASSTGAKLIIRDDGLAVSDPYNRFEGASETTFDAWLSYNRKIMNDDVDWKIQLNVRNLFGDEDDIVITTNPDGQNALYRIAPDVRSWFITNTLSF
ncbi:TonB-dependent receptor plug domain-containing protein [Pelagicoccus mobilis]|uniref:TonB-dependent receptor plug domain-containing protein n=1 Tax=Pelagicoccus mobilis TaxID=415221 RepID=A0A934RXB9_9BACT|nr:TonB-dependent receptor plug domain-containing protein [Pelagicoccus mobilis]MBK1875298.1 hypothetical protein [Pelagicoccus mobilis]